MKINPLNCLTFISAICLIVISALSLPVHGTVIVFGCCAFAHLIKYVDSNFGGR